MKEHRTPTGLSIIVAKDARPVGECFTCGVPFYSREEGERHMGPCARANLDTLRAQKLEERLPALAVQDPEVKEHWNGVGRRMIAEKRLTVKPNERASG